jgi:hypothetical protein
MTLSKPVMNSTRVLGAVGGATTQMLWRRLSSVRASSNSR